MGACCIVRGPLHQVLGDLGHHVVVAGGVLRGAGRALHVHDDDPDSTLGRHSDHCGIAEPGDVVDNPRTGGDGGAGHGGFAGVDGKNGFGISFGKNLDRGEDSPQLLLFPHLGGPGTGRFAANVEDCGTFPDQFFSLFYCSVEGVKMTSVRK